MKACNLSVYATEFENTSLRSIMTTNLALLGPLVVALEHVREPGTLRTPKVLELEPQNRVQNQKLLSTIFNLLIDWTSAPRVGQHTKRD